ncbi:hypothetical protein HDA32_003572 [Spinactinospora alkalitolerans]|uniref:Uncharacterized protein n=1 Tax=Spinactinospora alkalitolerans TaxID=687207 RepID=A0A852TZH8_9ACTN|nr:hypothetical protein [Spinactinospora alkalitolerans]NYE48452.1 hypothetical protein [Spinactinospora alkalitolerans]
MPHGFIDYYITGVLYPEKYLFASRVVAACIVAVSWAGIAIRVKRR